jgi:glycosyltransferase involved in cell wall biosynthesis
VRLSVIIPSYNGSHKLHGLMLDLSHQTLPASEVIVVLDGSRDDSLEQLEQWTTRLGSPLKVIYTPNGGRAVARNTGAREAVSELLLFFDDDIRIEPQLLDNHLKAQIAHPGCIHFGFALLEKGNEEMDPFTRYRVRQEKRWFAPYSEASLIQTENFTFTSQNFSILRSDFDRMGGFDERLRDSEDFDFAARWIISNGELWQMPDLRVGHRDVCTPVRYIGRQVEYRIWKKNLLQLHPEYRHYFATQFVFLDQSNRKSNSWLINLIGQWLKEDGSGAKWIPDRIISHYLTVCS